MSSFKNILIILIALTSAACAVSKKENERFDNMQSGQPITENTLTKDSISHENLKLFEDRAIQKLIEFYDYLNILGHENFNASIMSEVRSTAQQLFYNPEVSIDPYIMGRQEKPLKPIKFLLAENYGENALPEIEILHVEITQGLLRNDQGIFQGTLSFDIKNKSDAVIVSKETTFSLRKIEKKFGEETMKVWEVFLETID